MFKVIIFAAVFVVSAMGQPISYPQTYNKPAEAVVFPQPVNYVSQPSYLKPEYNAPYGAATVFVNPYDYPVPSAYPSAPVNPSANYQAPEPNMYPAPKYVAPEIIPAVVQLPNYANGPAYPVPAAPPTYLYESYNDNPLVYKAPKPCGGY
ncbi:hypothetical protein ACFFRR_010738 [Megaselia abdita]